MTLDVLLKFFVTYHLQNGTMNTQSYRGNIKNIQHLTEGQFLLSSQFTLAIIIRKDLGTHPNYFSGTSVTHYSPIPQAEKGVFIL